MPGSPEEEASAAGGPELITIPEIPDRMERSGLKRVEAARLRQLAKLDDWPRPVFERGRTRVYDWKAVETCLRGRTIVQGKRTDLEKKRAAEQPPSEE